MTDSRLRQIKTLSCPGQTPLPVYFIENNQRVKIKVLQIHNLNGPHKNESLLNKKIPRYKIGQIHFCPIYRELQLKKISNYFRILSE